MWSVMTAVMMAPVVAPWLVQLQRTSGTAALLPPFTAGYVVAWSGFNLFAASLQYALMGSGLYGPTGVLEPTVSGLACLLIGAYQLSPLKEQCRTQCGSPAGFFLTRWRSGRSGALRMGWAHGLHCLGCCVGLMLLALVVGADHLGWMALLTLLMVSEIYLPAGRNIAAITGWLLLALGVGLQFA